MVFTDVRIGSLNFVVYTFSPYHVVVHVPASKYFVLHNQISVIRGVFN